MRDSILERLNERPDLPPLPEIVLKIQSLIRNPKANAKSIAKLIEVDPALAGRILKLSNSAFYSRSTTPITSLPVAITKIGFTMLVKLVYSLKMSTLFTDSKLVSSTAFWKHNVAVAIFTQSLAKRTNISAQDQEIAYLAGLMHDIGIMVFAYLIPDEYGEFLHSVDTVEKALEIQELEHFGIDHAELGGRFIEQWWEVDERISLAVRSHHAPFNESAGERQCSDLVNVANGICNNFSITNGIKGYRDVFKEGAWDELGLSLADIDSIFEDVNKSVEQTNELIVK